MHSDFIRYPLVRSDLKSQMRNYLQAVGSLSTYISTLHGGDIGSSMTVFDQIQSCNVINF